MRDLTESVRFSVSQAECIVRLSQAHHITVGVLLVSACAGLPVRRAI